MCDSPDMVNYRVKFTYNRRTCIQNIVIHLYFNIQNIQIFFISNVILIYNHCIKEDRKLDT